MESEGVFILMFVVASAVAIVARRIDVPYTVALVVAGLVLGSLHAFEPPHLTKSFLFTICLPGLLFEAAFHTDFGEFWRNRLAIISLAVPGVVVAVGITAGILAPLIDQLQVAGGFTWRHAMVFGALLAATDPIAVVGLFKNLGAPKRLRMLIEGESLLNDGTSIVFFSIVLGLVVGGADLTVRRLTIDFVSAVGVGILVGGAGGLAVSELMKRIDDPMIEITLTTVAAYGTFVAAEHLHSSGVIATVTAGMLCGNYGARIGMSPSTRVAVETFWEYVAFALNSVVFLLIGFEVHPEAMLRSWQAIGVAYIAVVAARAAVIATASALLGLARERVPRTWSVVLAWGGLRGALSMVLALSLPATFPYRDLLITMTFGVVVLSLLLQGLTLAPLLRWLGIVRGAELRAEREFDRGRMQAADAAIQELDRIADTHYADGGVLDAVRGAYRSRIAAAEQHLQSLPLGREDMQREEQLWLERRLLVVEKDRVIEMLHRGLLRQHTYDRLVADIDARLLGLDSGLEHDTPEPADQDAPDAAPPGSAGKRDRSS
ncbi:MAG: Na+/H+ antiporter [bacterium]